MTFIPGYKRIALEGDLNYVFLFRGDLLVLKESNNELTVPLLTRTELTEFKPVNLQYLGEMDDKPCFAADMGESPARKDFVMTRLYDLFGRASDEIFRAAGMAFHFANWMRNALFCGRCGNPLKNHEKDRARECPNCGYLLYPRISPAVIVAVIRDAKILLARSVRSRGRFHSVLAGFIEAGESAEECVRREVMEEAGIKLKNIKYFDSQPWPFPDSLMLAFTAEYESGEITIDKREIIDAQWFSPDELPEVPGSASVARKLINWFISEYGRP